MRRVAASCVICTIVLSPAMLSPGAEQPPENEPSSTAAIAEMIDIYCMDCHSSPRARGGLGFAELQDPEAIRKAKPSLLLAIRDRLRARDMPPVDTRLDLEDSMSLRPTEEEFESAIAELGSVLRSQSASAGVPPVVVRRLNRVSYQNAIRDLLGVEVDVSSLPADDVGQAFDHLGEVLAVSPLLVEKLVDHAEGVARQAIIDPDVVNPEVQRFTADQLKGAHRRDRGIAWRNSTGEVFADVPLKRPGRYRAEFDLAGRQAGPDPVEFALRLDHDEQLRVEVPEEPKSPSIHGFEFSSDESAVRLGAAFLNDYHRPRARNPKDRDRNAAVVEIRVIGPLDPGEPTQIQQALEASVRRDGSRIGLARASRRLLERAWRRKVESSEALGVADLLIEASGENASVARRLQTLVVYALVSPQFVYQLESPLDKADVAADGTVPLNDYALATRLAAFLFCSIPDDELMVAARNGRLRSDGDLLRQVRRMLDDPRSRAFTSRFVSQWLRIDGVERLEPDPTMFAEVNADLLSDMRSETEACFDAMLRENRSVWELFEGTTTYLTPRLARHYGLDPVELGLDENGGLQQVDLADAGTAGVGLGVLGHASVLSSTSNPTRTSPVKRGKWVLEALLDVPPPPPPPGTPQLSSGVDGREEASLRALLELHRADPDCAVCHVRMDAIGLALETLDPVGRWRVEDAGVRIDASTVLPDGRILDGPVGVRDLLVGNPEVLRSLSAHMLSFALGRSLEWRDEPLIDDLVLALQEQPTIGTLVEKIVLSPQFRRMPAEIPEAGNG